MRNQEMLPVAGNDLRKSLIEPVENYIPYPSIEDVRAFTATTFAFDIETPKYRTLGDNAPVEMVGLSSAATTAMCVPVRGEYLSELKRIFREAKVIIGWNSISFDLPRLQKTDIKISEECQHYDGMLLHHLVFPDMPHGLGFAGSQFLSKPAWKNDKESLEVYNCRDTDVTYSIWGELLSMVKREGLYDLYTNIQVPLAKICLLMHETGFKSDPDRIGVVRARLLLENEKLERELPETLRSYHRDIRKRIPAPAGTLGKSGKPVKFIHVPDKELCAPWKSAKEVARYFYSNDPGCLGMEPILDLKTDNITTGKMAIAKIFARTHNPSVLALGKLKKNAGLLSTFANEGMLLARRIHPHFNVHGTSSGRLSSSDPNLQNVPESARCLYVPSHAGWKIVDVDFSNIENRLTAILAGDTERLRKYEQPGYSDYKLLVSRAFGIRYDAVIKDNDREAPYGKCKAIVLGINYGLGAKKISIMYDIPLKEVNDIMATWRKEIALTTTWQQKTATKASKEGVLTTVFGRKRWFWTSSAYTESLSFLPQSTAADIIFRVMIALMYERVGWPEANVKKVAPVYSALPEPAQLLLQVHDSLVFECPENLVEELIATVRRVMEQPWKELGGYSIPISVKVGDSWNDEV